MKIRPIQVPNMVKSVVVAAPLLFAAPIAGAMKNSSKPDTFERTTTLSAISDDKWDMSPRIRVAGENIYPAVVIDKSEKKLYLYDLETYLDTVYTLNSSSVKKLQPGLRVITGVENNDASDKAGTQIIKMGLVDTKTGEISDYNGGVIRGRKAAGSTDKNQSKNSLKLQNKDIKNLAEWLFEEQYVLIKE